MFLARDVASGFGGSSYLKKLDLLRLGFDSPSLFKSSLFSCF